VPRPVLLALIWTAPAAFILSFFEEYLARPPSELVALWTVVALASGVPPLLVPSWGIRIAGGLTMLLILYCTTGMVDNASKEGSGTGFGAVIFIPLALVVILAQLVFAIIVSLRSG
jgi:hypothetical protein